MPTSNHNLPTIAKGEQRSKTDRNTSAKGWSTAYLPGYERPQLEAARELIGRLPEAHRPFHTPARVAYQRLSAALD